MDGCKLYLNIGEKKEEFHPISAINLPVTETDNVSADCSELGREMSVSFKADDGMKRFKGRMERELSVVDITYWPAQMIEKLISTFPHISKLVTHDVDHYQMLQTEDGYACVAGDYDNVFGVPLILDKKKKIKAAHISFKKKGGGTNDDE